MTRQCLALIGLLMLGTVPAFGDVIVYDSATTPNAIVTPPQWNEGANTVVCVGAGGGGASGQTATTGGSGGGGGAARYITNANFEGFISALLGQTGGAGGTPGNPGSTAGGGDLQISLYYGAGAACSVPGGIGGNGSTPGAGGAAGSGGTGGFHGGAGGLGGDDSVGSGTCTPVTCAGGGGGGAAGQNGVGNPGAAFAVQTGGSGGQGDSTFGGLGGAGGATTVSGTAGANGTEFNNSYGSGGGGGAGGEPGGNGANGGLCGAGGGGAGDNAHSGGNGRNGCIIFSYTPTTDTNLGYSGAAHSTASDVAQLDCNSWTAPVSGAGSTLKWSLHTNVTGHVVLGLYDSNGAAGGVPPLLAGTPLASTAILTNPTAGLRTDNLTSTVGVSRGHLYWLCFSHDSTIVTDADSPLTTDLGYAISYTGTLPSVVGTAPSLDSDHRPIMYIPLTSTAGNGLANPFLQGPGL